MLQFLGPIANLAGTWLENKVEKNKSRRSSQSR